MKQIRCFWPCIRASLTDERIGTSPVSEVSVYYFLGEKKKTDEKGKIKSRVERLLKKVY